MRYSNGEVSEAQGYHWYRDSSHGTGFLVRLDASGNFIVDPTTGYCQTATEYSKFAVFACNPLLPLMVTDSDPLLQTGNWELLRIFHPPGNRGLSQVVTLESPMREGRAPVRYVAGRNPSWIPALIPKTYRSPIHHSPDSRGLGGELPIILGLMALTAESNPSGNDAVNTVFLERRAWRRQEWRGGDTPRGCK
ncbi:hypothetical protein LCI18_006140 [Fusarium solani-melongenae]|uniref:Uncharacterized protein n=1 Tax=Fusarium solani subsp. cucurbitae TaxID=2747967 RepID=A0ACD3Z1X9_FUSSC|nr:hypothetical protein LCI18_006140 [Fusarium solani-melongenae]